MPYLMLEFKADREVTEKAGQMVPTGNEHIEFRMIDTDSGKVVEMKADAKNIKQTERPANFGESHTASQVLGQEPGQKPSQRWQDQMTALEAERDSYRQKVLSGQAALDSQKKVNIGLKEQIDGLKAHIKSKQTSPIDDELIAAALDGYIAELAASQQFDTYEVAKQLYERVTGSSWADDGSDDDEELLDDDEDDPAKPGFANGGVVRGLALDFGDIDYGHIRRWMDRFYKDNEGQKKEFWNYSWDKFSEPDPTEDLLKWAKQMLDDGKKEKHRRPYRLHMSHEEYERRFKLLYGENFVWDQDQERFIGGEKGLYQFSPPKKYSEIKISFVDSQFQENIRQIEDNIYLLGLKSGKTLADMEALRKIQQQGYMMYFLRENGSEIKIPNFRLEIPRGHKKSKQRKIPKNTRDIVDTKQRWRKDSLRKQ